MSSYADEFLGDLEALAQMTDEQILEKYKDCFNFESEYLAKIKAGGGSKITDDNDDPDSEEEIEQAKKRILEKKKTKKQQQDEALKKLLLDDLELLK